MRLVGPSALIKLEESGNEFAAAIRYYQGVYEVLIEPDDVPGLSGYSLNPDLYRRDSFRFNEAGEAAIRVRVISSGSDTNVTWLRGQPNALEPVITWGEGSGEVHAEYGEYLFRWPFLSIGNSAPAITENGTVSIYASTKTHRDEDETDPDWASLKAIWSVPPGSEDPEVFVTTKNTFTNQDSGATEEFNNIAPGTQNQGYSLNDQGQIALLNGYTDDGTSKIDLWFRDADGYWPIARHGSVAPDTDDVDVSTGATFGSIGVPALSNTGLMTFQAEVEGQTSVWVSDRDNTRPVAIEGMSAPGLDNTEFSRIGLNGLPPMLAPFINNRDQVVFLAELTDTNTGTDRDSLWLYDQCNGLWLIAMQGQEFELEGVPVVVDWDSGQAVRGTETAVRTLRSLDTPSFSGEVGPTGPNTGQLYPLNDQGQLVFSGDLVGEHSTGLIDEGDTGTYSRQDVILKAQLPQCET